MEVESFFNELEKIGEGYSAPTLAHELGHAQRAEKGWSPKAEQVLRMAAPVAGTAGSIYGVLKRKPLLAGSLSLLGSAPLLVEEAGASLRGYKALKKIGLSESDLKQARKVMMKAFGTYGSHAGGSALGSAGAALIFDKSIKHGNPVLASMGPTLAKIIGMSSGAVIGKKLNESMRRGIKKSKKLTSDELEALRNIMALKTKVYEGKKNAPEFYISKDTLFRKARGQVLKGFLKNPREVKELNSKGGIILPTER
jgi:hypothetical protein